MENKLSSSLYNPILASISPLLFISALALFGGLAFIFVYAKHYKFLTAFLIIYFFLYVVADLTAYHTSIHKNWGVLLKAWTSYLCLSMTLWFSFAIISKFSIPKLYMNRTARRDQTNWANKWVYIPKAIKSVRFTNWVGRKSSITLGIWYILWPLQYLLAFSLLGIALFIPVLYLSFLAVFKTHVTTDVFRLFFNTYPKEMFEFFQTMGALNWVLLMIPLILGINFLFIRESRYSKAHLSVLISLLAMNVLALFYMREHNLLIYKPYLAAKEYLNEIKILENAIDKRRNTQNMTLEMPFKAKKERIGETYLVIIGESLNREHLRIYGYSRKTTPNLSKVEDLLIFNQAYANDILSIKVLTFALTEANQYNEKKYYSSLSIIGLLNELDFKTYWLSNQPLTGFLPILTTTLAQESHHLYDLHKTGNSQHGYFDEVLFGQIKAILNEKTEKNRVIFVHLIGNHTNYCSRYPDRFNHFPESLPEEFSTCVRPKMLKCYDDSVRYNDFVVSEMLNMLHSIQGARGMIYFSDHGEDVCALTPRNTETLSKSMLHTPLIMWFSKEYKDIYLEKYQSLINNQKKLFSNDLLFDTFVGIFDIQTNNYEARFNLASPDFHLNEEEALVLRGQRKYMEVPQKDP